MRVPLVIEIDSRDGESNKDERLTNVLVEDDEGRKLAVVRAGLSTAGSTSGNGNGVVNFNGVLVNVFGATLSFGATPSTIATVYNDHYDFAQSPL